MSNKETVMVVAIGASAGGLEALERFFQKLPSSTGMAFIVVQHLSPDFKSLMGELLARYTTMNIQKVESDTAIEPNTVYLIPPKKQLSVSGGKIFATDFSLSQSLRLPVDHLFTSLAAEFGKNAIGVILSGTGSDGTEGAKAISEAGGHVIVQDPITCKFDGMPLSAIRAGYADFICTPEEMPELLVQIGNRPFGSGKVLQRKSAPFEQDLLPGQISTIYGDNSFMMPLSSAEDVNYAEILNILSMVDQVDFTQYRTSTIRRRIERRVKENRCRSLSEYCQLLRSNAQEKMSLHGELLIGVTRFFRDKESFDYLRNEIIPKICAGAGRDPIRIWVAGCSTGEEAYSLGILFLNYFESRGLRNELKIFATDIDREALQIAAAGVFDADELKDMEPIILERYFIRSSEGYVVNPELRKLILFSFHDVTRDPPFTKLDLVSCRNLLIYFQIAVQTKVLSLFHFGLRKDRFLFLGRSETTGELSQEFAILTPYHKVFQKLREVRLPFSGNGVVAGMARERLHSVVSKPVSSYGGSSDLKLGLVYEKLMNEYVPPGFLLDANLTIVHVFGNAAEFFQIPTGKLTFELNKILPQEIAVPITSAVAKARSSDSEVICSGIQNPVAGKGNTIKLKVRPGSSLSPGITGYFLVLVEDLQEKQEQNQQSDKSDSIELDPVKGYPAQITLLQEQLSLTSETLQSTIEELETTNEELQSTNEELMSSNEELQSANEELHSVNEELYTVNSEYQKKIDELIEANSDIDFLVRNTRVAIVFLAPDLSVRRFTPGVSSIIKLRPPDVGRPIHELRFLHEHNLIISMIEEVVQTHRSKSAEILLGSVTFIVNVIPYKEDDGLAMLSGRSIAIAFTDVSNSREMDDIRQSLQECGEFALSLVNVLQSPIHQLGGHVRALKELNKQKDISGIEQLLPSVELRTTVLERVWRAAGDFLRIENSAVEAEYFLISRAVLEATKKACIADSKLSLIGQVEIFAIFEQIVELFGHVLENSLQHSQFGSNLHLRCEVRAHSDCAEILLLERSEPFMLEENGFDLLALYKETPDVVEKFRKVFHSALEIRLDGLGMGLPMVQRILKRNRGSLRLFKNKQNGSWAHLLKIPAKPSVRPLLGD